MPSSHAESFCAFRVSLLTSEIGNYELLLYATCEKGASGFLNTAFSRKRNVKFTIVAAAIRFTSRDKSAAASYERGDDETRHREVKS